MSPYDFDGYLEKIEAAGQENRSDNLQLQNRQRIWDKDVDHAEIATALQKIVQNDEYPLKLYSGGEARLPKG